MFADAAVWTGALCSEPRAACWEDESRTSLVGLRLIVPDSGALLEVVRRAVVGKYCGVILMMSIGLVALIANVTCLVLIARSGIRAPHDNKLHFFCDDVIADQGDSRWCFGRLDGLLVP